jgi:hypothetical protein
MDNFNPADCRGSLKWRHPEGIRAIGSEDYLRLTAQRTWQSTIGCDINAKRFMAANVRDVVIRPGRYLHFSS